MAESVSSRDFRIAVIGHHWFTEIDTHSCGVAQFSEGVLNFVQTGFELVLCHPFFKLDSKANHRRLPVSNWYRPFPADVPERQIEELE